MQAREEGDESGVDVVEEPAAISVELRRLGIRSEGLDGRVPRAGRRLGIRDESDCRRGEDGGAQRCGFGVARAIHRATENVGLDLGPEIRAGAAADHHELPGCDSDLAQAVETGGDFVASPLHEGAGDVASGVTQAEAQEAARVQDVILAEKAVGDAEDTLKVIMNLPASGAGRKRSSPPTR